MMPPSLSLLVPALNEEAGLGEAIAACGECADRLVASRRATRVDIVVVDDGSTDGTPEVLRQLGCREPRLLVRRHERNRGLGAALRTGFDAVETDLVFYTDADLPVDLRVVDRSIDLLGDDEATVSVYRSRRTGEGPRRFVYSVMYNQLCRVTLGLRVRDVNFAAKLVRTEHLRSLGLRSEGSFIDAELLSRLQRSGIPILQFPATYRPRSKGVSTLSSRSVILGMLREMRQLSSSIRATGPRLVRTA